MPEQPLRILASAALAIVPLAAWMGHATESLASLTGEGVAGFLNATSGNVVEHANAPTATAECPMDLVPGGGLVLTLRLPVLIVEEVAVHSILGLALFSALTE